jgi:hypothetical protein
MFRYQEAAELNQLMSHCAREMSVYDQVSVDFEIQSQEISVGLNDAFRAKRAAIKARYKSKITTAEEELRSLTKREDTEIKQSQEPGVKEEASQAGKRILAYEISVAVERVEAEEALAVLWTAWSFAADKYFTHRPQDQAIVNAFSVLLTSRRKLAAAVEKHIADEKAESPNSRIPIWLRTEPTLPTELQPDAWWPRKPAARADSEKTLAALVASVDRTLKLSRERLEGESAVQGQIEYGLPHSVSLAGSRGTLALVAAKRCHEGSAKILVSLEAAAADLKSHSGPMM